MEQLEHNEKEIEYIRFFTMRLYMIESILRNQYREILNKYIKLYFREDLKDVKQIFESIRKSKIQQKQKTKKSKK